MVGLAIVVASLFEAGSGSAQNKRTAIALVAGGAPRELHTRLRAELTALGWRVREMPLGDDVALAQVARRAKTLAVVRVGRSAEGIELWVAPEVDAEARSEWVDVDPRRPELAVLRAVEALRARFLELGIEPEDMRDAAGDAAITGGVTERPPEPKSEANKPDSKEDPHKGGGAKAGAAKAGAVKAGTTPQSEDANLHIWGDMPSDADPGALPAAPPLRRAVWLGAGGGVASASSVLGPNVSLVGVLHVVPSPKLGLGLEFWWPPSTSSIESVEGSAEARPVLAAISGEYRHRRGQFVVAGGGGLGLLMLFTQGSAELPYIGRQAAAYSSLPFGRLAGEFDLSQRVHLRAEGTLGFSLPRAIVSFNGREVASWGRPFLGGSLSFEAALFGD
jgi:hypothetical protein